MKKILFIAMMLIFASCTTQKNITSENRVNMYNVLGEKIIEVKTDESNLKQGVYYLRIINNDEKSPYWTKIVKIDL
jgi:hypothetical protein